MKRPTIAALVYPPGVDPSPVLVEVARVLQARGIALAGAIQHSNGPCSMTLEILPSGARIGISQNLGSESTGCRLNPAALAEAASMVRKEIGHAPALTIFNKFGAQEAAGDGMANELAEAVLAGQPVLTAVSASLIEKWDAFTGGEYTRLAFSAEDALAWWDALAESVIAP